MAQFPLRQVPTCGWPGQADARNAYVRACLHNLCDGIKMLDLVESAAPRLESQSVIPDARRGSGQIVMWFLLHLLIV